MQEPFCSVPLIWIIQEDTLANRLQLYENMGWDHLISNWKNALSRADVVVFPEFSFPVNISFLGFFCTQDMRRKGTAIGISSVIYNIFMLYQMLYSMLDTGNFFVIPGSPIDVWAAESYSKTNSKFQLRKENGFDTDDMLVVIVGSSFFYNELPWDYALAMHDLEPLLLKYAGSDNAGLTSKFIFLCGNSSKDYSDALQVCSYKFDMSKVFCFYCIFQTYNIMHPSHLIFCWKLRTDIPVIILS